MPCKLDVHNAYWMIDVATVGEGIRILYTLLTYHSNVSYCLCSCTVYVAIQLSDELYSIGFASWLLLLQGTTSSSNRGDATIRCASSRILPKIVCCHCQQDSLLIGPCSASSGDCRPRFLPYHCSSNTIGSWVRQNAHNTTLMYALAAGGMFDLHVQLALSSDHAMPGTVGMYVLDFCWYL